MDRIGRAALRASRLGAVAFVAMSMIAGSAGLGSAPPRTLQPAADPGLCGLDIVWMQGAAEGDRFEIKGGKLALRRSHLKEVRVLAKTLVKDHTASLADLQALAKKLGVDLPKEPSPTQQWELEELGEMHGREFNHDYSELEVLDHMQDISEAQDEVDLGCNDDVRAMAKGEIPTLEEHLALSKKALQASGLEHRSHD